MIVKYLLFILIACFLGACNNNGADKMTPAGDSAKAGTKDLSSRFIYTFADTALLAKIADTLMKLPFVRKSDRYIDSFSNHTQGISFLPDTANGEISVMAGYNGPERFETYYNFNINPVTFGIRILDPLSGEFISIEDYIKNNKE